MKHNLDHSRRLAVLASVVFSFQAASESATDAPLRWVQATAYVIPKETTNEGEGYFSVVTGLNGRIYVGTSKHGNGSYLVEFDPKTEQMRIVVDVHKEVGINAKGFGAQAKIQFPNTLPFVKDSP